MKKSILGIVLLAMALSVQAGVVNWQITGIKAPDGVTAITALDQLYVELYYRANANGGSIDSSAGWELTDGANGTLVMLGADNLLSGVNLDSYTTPFSGQGSILNNPGSGTAIWTQDEAVENRSVNKYASFYVKVYYKASGSAGSGSGQYTDSGISKFCTVDLRNITSGPGSLGMTSASSKITWTAVPEPATMALFGLGGLALVIRRKMRKEA